MRTKKSLVLSVLLALACTSGTEPDAGSGGEVATVRINPTSSTLALGAQMPLQATVEDAAGQAVSNVTVVWTVRDPDIASVSSAGIVTGLALGTTQVAANANGKSAVATVIVQKTPVATLIVLPDRADVTAGQKLQLNAVAYDLAQNVLTERGVFWTSSNVGVATVDAAGMLTGVGAGVVTITATSEGKSASASITVTQGAVATVTVTPSPLSLGVGQSVLAVATARSATGAVITGRQTVWSSSNLSVATVGQDGTVVGVGPGTAIVSATTEGQTGSTTVTVSNAPIASVAILPASSTITPGASVQLSAVATDINGATLTGRPVTWSTSNPAVATVSLLGLVTGVSPGSVVITGSSEGKSGTATVNVTQTAVGSVTVTPTTTSLTVGQSAVITATTRDGNGATLTGRVVTWTSSDPAVATVSLAGVVTAVAPGIVTITASSEGKSGAAAVTVTAVPVASVTVSPTSASVVQGQTTTLTATAKDAGGNTLTRAVTWTSSNNAVATVSQAGVVTGVAPGSAIITATSETKTGTSSVTVTAPPAIPVNTVTVSPSTVSLVQGQTSALTATTRDANNNVLTGRAVTWTSNNEAVATVNAATGVVTAVAPGSATITATSEGKTGTSAVTVTAVPVSTVTVSPATLQLVQGQTSTLTATTRDVNNNVLNGRTVTWSSNSAAVAVNATTGVVTAVSPGSATITATSEGKSGTSSITVTAVQVASVTIAPTSASVVQGQTTTLVATAKDASGNILTGRTFTWSSNNNAVATVTQAGVVTAVSVGSATITASTGGQSGTSSITVTAPPPASVSTVTVAPSAVTLAPTQTQTFTTTLKDANGNTLTGRTVTWSSSNPLVASVNATTGVVTALLPGNTTITATSETKTGTAAVTVAIGPVSRVEVSPASANVKVGSTVQLTAKAYDAFNNEILGKTFTWTTNNDKNATVASTGAATALVTGVKPNTTATITASVDSKSDDATINVTPP